MTEKNEKKTILIVDDEAEIVDLLSKLSVKQGYRTLVARDGSESVKIALKELPDLILMDVIMPGMNGFEATETLKKNRITAHIPIIIVTGHDSQQERLIGIAMGANDFITKPFNTEELALRIKNNLKIKEYGDFLNKHNAVLEDQVQLRTKELNATMEKLNLAYEKININHIETIYRLTLAAEYRDDATGTHIKRTSQFTRSLAQEMGLDKELVELLYYSAPLHDVGKVGIPDHILLKSGSLTPEEWKIIKNHTMIGAKILGGSESLFLQTGEIISMSHHERWDGGGYPLGLKGEAIPLVGRIINIIDQYDAMRSARSYKPAFDHEKTFKIITLGDGRTMPTHFDPRVLAAFKVVHREFARIYDSF